MDVDHRLARVEGLVDRREARIPEVLVLVAGEEAYSIGLERFESELDLVEAAFYIRRRDGGEQPVAPRMVLHEPRAILVESAVEASRLLDIVAIPGAGLDYGEDRSRDAAPVHLLERKRGRPRRRGRAGAAPARHHGLDVERRDEVVMDV